ncbi:Protochlorophyllide-dependent translocon component 52, chloroplastic [Linum perenne]
MDPAHLPYAHCSITETQPPKGTQQPSQQGGRPLEMTVDRIDINGFEAELEFGNSKFIAPYIFYMRTTRYTALSTSGNSSLISTMQPSMKILVIFLCTPTSPGNSRLIWAFSRNFSIWVDKVIPRWMFHMGTNLVLDSDLYLLHAEERKIEEIGTANWHKTCFVPTKADALVVGFRRWLNKYGGGGVDWRGKYSGYLPPTAPKEQLMDRYTSHVVNCSDCNRVYKSLNALEIILQVASVGIIGIAAATNQGILSTAARTGLGILAIACFAASRWLAFFVHNNFRYHGYNHSFPEKVMLVVRKLSPTV